MMCSLMRFLEDELVLHCRKAALSPSSSSLREEARSAIGESFRSAFELPRWKADL